MERKSVADVSKNFKAKIFPLLIMAFCWMPFALSYLRELYIKPWIEEIERTGKHPGWHEISIREQEAVFAYVAFVLLVILTAWLIAHLRWYFESQRQAALHEQDLLANLNLHQK